MRLPKLLVFCVAVVSGSGANEGDGSCDADSYDLTDPEADHRGHAIKLDEQGDMAGAILSFRAEVGVRPSAAEWNNLGVAISDPSNRDKTMQQYDEASTCFKNALKMDPENQDAQAGREDLEDAWWMFLPNGVRNR